MITIIIIIIVIIIIILIVIVIGLFIRHCKLHNALHLKRANVSSFFLGFQMLNGLLLPASTILD